MPHRKSKQGLRKDGFYNFTIGAETSEALDKVRAELTTRFGFDVNRQRAILHLIHFYEKHKGDTDASA